MSGTTSRPWSSLKEGETVLLGFVKIDRKDATNEWRELPPDEVRRRRSDYISAVEKVASDFDAAKPLHWQGDGLMLFFKEDAESPAPDRAWWAAMAIWQSVRVQLSFPVRMAVFAAKVAWNPDTGKVADLALDQCGHLEQVAPVNALAVCEDIYLALPPNLQSDLSPLGVTSRDHTPAYVYPSAAAARKNPADFLPSSDLDLWAAFRKYANGPEIRKLRYVGFNLTRKEPPALDVLDVFVPPEVQQHRAEGAMRFPPESEANGTARESGGDDIDREEVPFARFEDEVWGMPRPLVETIRRERNLVVLGDPGSGKTTVLRWLAVVAAGGRLSMSREFGSSERLLPLTVSVGKLAELRAELKDRHKKDPSVLEALAAYFHGRNVGQENEVREFLRSRLDGGDCLVLFDGLDEVKAQDRLGVRGWLETFAGHYSKNRFVVSCRLLGYRGFQLPGGTEVCLRAFSDEQVDRYVRAFCTAYRRWESGADDPKGADEKATDLLRALRKSPRLHALARNPFMLSGIALVHRAAGRLPRHRVLFYEKFAQALCETWGAARRIVAEQGARDIPFEEEAVPILGSFAFRMHCEYPTGSAPEDFVVEALSKAQTDRGTDNRQAERAAREFLHRSAEQVQILLERGPGQWGFLHLTFQEFFAAAGLHAAEKFEEEAFKRLFDPRWEEVIRLGVGYLALCQKRPTAARQFVEKVFAGSEDVSNPWITKDLRRHIPLAVLLAAEAGEALPPALQDEIARAFVAWAEEFPCMLADRISTEIALTDYRDRLAREYLEALKDKKVSVRARAAAALGQLKAEAALPALLEALKDNNVSVRDRAATGLGQLKAEAALPALLEALKDKEAFVRARAAAALGQLKAEAALPALLEALKDKEASVRGHAADALGQLKAEAALQALLEPLKDKDASVRARAATALGQLKAEAALPVLLEVFKDKDASVRGRAAAALGQLKAEAALPALLEALKDKDASVRARAAAALGQLKAEAALPALLEVLEDNEVSVRARAATALGQLKAEAALPALLEVLKDKEAFVRGRAAAALGQLKAEAALPALLEALKDKEAFVRARTATALGQLKAEAAFPALLEALKDKDASVRARAADAMGQLKAEAALPALLEAFKDKKASVRARAADALGQHRAEAALPALLEALKDKDASVRARAADSLENYLS
jgi:HEAT repeat protein